MNCFQNCFHATLKVTQSLLLAMTALHFAATTASAQRPVEPLRGDGFGPAQRWRERGLPQHDTFGGGNRWNTPNTSSIIGADDPILDGIASLGDALDRFSDSPGHPNGVPPSNSPPSNSPPPFPGAGAGGDSQPIPGDVFEYRVNPRQPRLGFYSERVNTRNFSGLRVQRIVSGTIAEEIGLEPGDIIVGVNNRAIQSMDDYYAALRYAGRHIRLLLHDVRGRGYFQVHLYLDGHGRLIQHRAEQI